jgi:hypothetical protein
MFSGEGKGLICVRQRYFLEKGILYSAYVRDVFWSRPGFNPRPSNMFSGVDQDLISVRQRCVLEKTGL